MIDATKISDHGDTLSYGYIMSNAFQAQAMARGECQARGFKNAVLIKDEISLRLGRDKVATFRCE